MRYLQHVEKFIDGMKVVEVVNGTAHSDAPTFFCMHGYGANCYDLAGLSEYLQMPEGSRLIFPDGILGVDLGMGAGHMGRAWFPIDWNEIERIRREGGLRDLSKSLPAGMAEARDKVAAALKKLECDPAQTVLAGFSQGAMLATEIALHSPDYFAGLVILSGTLVHRTGWQNLLQEKYVAKQKTLQFIQSHGRHDPVLPFQAAERLNALLNENGGTGALLAFEGAHEIPQGVLDGTNKWLKKLF